MFLALVVSQEQCYLLGTSISKELVYIHCYSCLQKRNRLDSIPGDTASVRVNIRVARVIGHV